MKKLYRYFSLWFFTSIIFIIFIVIIENYNIHSAIIFTTVIFSALCFAALFIILNKNKITAGIIIFILLFVLLFLRIISIRNHYSQSIKEIEKSEQIIGYIDGFPMNKKDKLEYRIKIIGIKNKKISDYKKIRSFNIIAKVKNKTNLKINRGDVIVINTKIKKPVEKIYDFKYREYLYYHNVYGVIYINEENIQKVNTIKPYFITILLKKTVWKLRLYILDKLRNKIRDDVFSFLLSIFFGIRSELDPECYEKFRNTGMVHLLAISGLHIGFIGMVFYKFFKFFLSKSKSLIISSIMLFIFILLINPSASSLRAFLMYLIAAFFFVSGINTNGVTGLSLSAVLLIYMNPFYIFDLGFQFSFLATTGIMFLASEIKEKLPRKIPVKLKSIISVTLSAFLSIFFIQWALFRQVPVFSLISSLIMVPVFGLLFSTLFFLIAVLILFDFSLIVYIIEFLCLVFLKTIDILNFIPVVKLPGIPLSVGYLFLPCCIIYLYIIDPIFIKIIMKIKVFLINRLYRS